MAEQTLNSCSDIANRNRRKALSKFLKIEKELFESYPTQKRFHLENNGSMQFVSTTKNNLFKKRNSKIYIHYRIQLPPEDLTKNIILSIQVQILLISDIRYRSLCLAFLELQLVRKICIHYDLIEYCHYYLPAR